MHTRLIALVADGVHATIIDLINLAIRDVQSLSTDSEPDLIVRNDGNVYAMRMSKGEIHVAMFGNRHARQ